MIASVTKPFPRLIVTAMIAVLFGVLVSGCDVPRYRHDLVEADSMLRRESLDSADAILSAQSPREMNSADYAYFNLLSSALQFKRSEGTLNDSILRGARDYFHSHGDRANECLTDFYMGMSAMVEDDLSRGILIMKDAERLLPAINDNYISARVVSGLVAVNYFASNDTTALRYAYRELSISRNADNPTWITFAYNHLGCVYLKLNHPDSAYHYFSMIEPMLDDVAVYARSQNLENLSDFYLDRGDHSRAVEYAEKAFVLTPSLHYGNFLANTAAAVGDTIRALTLWHDLLPTAEGESRADLLESLAKVESNVGHHAEALRLNREALAIRDSLRKQQIAGDISRLQLDFDRHEDFRRERNGLLVLIGILSALVAVGLLLGFRQVAKRRVQRETVAAYRSRILNLESRSQALHDQLASLEGELSRQDALHARELTKIRKEIEEHNREHADRMAHGRKLFDDIADGRSVGRWSKEDFNCFFEYYDVIEPAFRREVEERYTGLSYGNRLLLILERMGMDSKRICTVLGISPGSLRSARSRLKSKLLD